MATSQETSDLQSALKRLGVGAQLGFYNSIIDSEAERTNNENCLTRATLITAAYCARGDMLEETFRFDC